MCQVCNTHQPAKLGEPPLANAMMRSLPCGLSHETSRGIVMAHSFCPSQRRKGGENPLSPYTPIRIHLFTSDGESFAHVPTCFDPPPETTAQYTTKRPGGLVTQGQFPFSQSELFPDEYCKGWRVALTHSGTTMVHGMHICLRIPCDQ